MTTIGHAGNVRLTPRQRLNLNLAPNRTPTKQIQEDASLQVTLRSVIGTTTSSPNAFDTLPDHDSFVICAGPAVILHRVDHDLNITQHLYRARPSTAPINSTSSFYNPSTPPNTPRKPRYGSPFKDAGYEIASAAERNHDSPGQARANLGTREATCVSLSKCGSLMAVGETGYNPRVLIFSTAPNAPRDIPLSVLTDHSFGVSAVAFSSDSRWLCTLGNSHDAFILVYSVNTKTGMARLHSSNKCSSVTSVAWMGQSLISMGLRHVKVWRLDRSTPISSTKTRHDLENGSYATPGSPLPKAFSGRNCILGDFIDATFTAAVAISDQRAIICTSSGEVCLLNDTDRMQRLEKITKIHFGISCILYDSTRNVVWLAGSDGNVRPIGLQDLIKPVVRLFEPSQYSVSGPHYHGPRILSIGRVRNRIITVNTDRTIDIRAADDGAEGASKPIPTKTLPSHHGAVLGVYSLLPKLQEEAPDFLTFCSKGVVLFWQLNGTSTGSIEVLVEQPSCAEEGIINELKTVNVSAGDTSLITGDRRGVLRLVEFSGVNISGLQAHSSDINAIATAKLNGSTVIASCGRDRTLQLLRKETSRLDLIQTLDDHAASVTDALFTESASQLLSISSDRTVIVRKIAFGEEQALAYLKVRVITLKASPIALAGIPWEPNVIVVSTMDKSIQTYDISSGRLNHSFTASDPPSGESMLLKSMEAAELDSIAGHGRMILGVSSTDKSIRIHDYESGAMISREYGQTAISAINLIQTSGGDQQMQAVLISCGLDGTIMIWDVTSNLSKSTKPDCLSNDAISPTKINGTSTQPLRRILSRAEISDFQKGLEDEGDTVSPIPTRTTSPSRMKRKTSRYSLAAIPKISPPSLANRKHGTALSVEKRNERNSSGEYTPTPSSPHHTMRAKARRPSLDPRRRSKSAANLNDLNESAEQICKSLQNLRKRIPLSAADKLKPDTAKELENELRLTLEALSNPAEHRLTRESIGGEALEAYLARMIDERMALKVKSEEVTNLAPESGPEDDYNAISGAQE